MDIQSLLEPVSEEGPSGEDLEYEPEFGALERTAKRVPEQESGGATIDAVEPDWRSVREEALALFERTRDFRVALHLTKALTRIDGYDGLRNGLNLIHRLAADQWDTVHPRLDEDDGDCTIRCNAVQDLVNREEDGLLQAVLDASFVSAKVAGRFCLRDLKIIAGELTQRGDDDRAAPQAALIDAAVREVGGDEVQAVGEQVSECAAAVAGIQDAFVSQVGAVNAPDLSELGTLIDETNRFLTKQLAGLGLGEAPTDDGTGAGGPVAGGGGQPISGQVSSREDVVRLLDKVCAYYEQNEPSSPVPMLLQRAKRLVYKGFMEIIEDLTPTGVGEAKVFDRGAGTSYDGPGPGPGASEQVESSDDSW